MGAGKDASKETALEVLAQQLHDDVWCILDTQMTDEMDRCNEYHQTDVYVHVYIIVYIYIYTCMHEYTCFFVHLDTDDLCIDIYHEQVDDVDA